MDLAPGVVISNRYQIIKELAQGGFGKVFLAEDLMRFNSQCIVKKFIQPFSGNSELESKAKELFYTEAKILSDFEKYEQVPDLLAYLEAEECIVQEFIQGKTLTEELALHEFDEHQILDILSELLPLLKAIHEKGIFHRDIKPDNIIRNIKNNKLVLIDFGIAKNILELGDSIENINFIEGSLTLNSTIIGTPGYKSPDNTLSAKSDLYSLGATLVHLLIGISPEILHDNYGDDWCESYWINIRNKVNKPILNILEKLLGVNGAIRYENAEQVLIDIKDIDEIRQKERVDFLLYVINNTPEEKYQYIAINDLIELGRELNSIIPILINMLKSDNEQHNSVAESQLIKIGQESSVYVAKLLEEDKVDTRRLAASILTSINLQAEVVPYLIIVLKDTSYEVRWYATIALGSMGIEAKDAIPALIEVLKDTSPGICAYAAFALGSMGIEAKDAIPTLLEILNINETHDVFIASLEALESLGYDIEEITINIVDGGIPTGENLSGKQFIRKHREEQLKQLIEQRNRPGINLTFRRIMSSNTPPQGETWSSFYQGKSLEKFYQYLSDSSLNDVRGRTN